MLIISFNLNAGIINCDVKGQSIHLHYIFAGKNPHPFKCTDEINKSQYLVSITTIGPGFIGSSALEFGDLSGAVMSIAYTGNQLDILPGYYKIYSGLGISAGAIANGQLSSGICTNQSVIASSASLGVSAFVGFTFITIAHDDGRNAQSIKDFKFQSKYNQQKYHTSNTQTKAVDKIVVNKEREDTESIYSESYNLSVSFESSNNEICN